MRGCTKLARLCSSREATGARPLKWPSAGGERARPGDQKRTAKMNRATTAGSLHQRIAAGRAAPAGSRVSGRPIGAPLACRITPAAQAAA